MKQIITFLFFISLSALSAKSADAGVNFIVQSPLQKQQTIHATQRNACVQKGYKKRSCPEGSFAASFCPEDSSYFKKCCDISVYKYPSFSYCTKFNRLPGDECGGLYSCED